MMWPRWWGVLLMVPALACAAPVTFDVYLQLHVGMSEAELLKTAGKPDHVDVRNGRELWWLGNDDTPAQTIVKIESGKVSAIRREQSL
ncbi:hypothetical protein [Paludibacterium yongneupense]|uniref:hypothetical protein n=1 Tax=Paludibacterium yongneupense TaxID=400061 RepID=UPI00048C4895|nr:hypothetical protein [Paludibacterium yongneupense]